MNGYITYYNGNKHEVQANTLFEAKEKGIAHFKPAKSKHHMVSAVLAEKQGEQVTHDPAIL